MKFILPLVLFFLIGSVDGQDRRNLSGNVKGRVNILNTEQPLFNATVVLLNAADSSVVRSCIVDSKGLFSLNRLKLDVFLLHITHIGYQPVWRHVTISEKDSLIDLGIIYIQKNAIMLDLIEIVNRKPSMVLKRDTVEFNISSLNIREDATMEELLRRLPGIRVERDGTIKVSGESVKRLLINGRVFLGDDPKTATRNLSVDMIDKVQFIDRKSDWSQFTGVSDGYREKAINIVIKDERKDTYFGRASGALATGGHFAVGGTLNRFSEDQQLVFEVKGTNINGYQEGDGQNKVLLGGSNNVKDWNVGVNYGRDIGKAIKITSNYSLNEVSTIEIGSSERQNILPDTSWRYNQNTRSVRRGSSHSFSSSAEFRIDTTHMINVSIGLTYNAGSNLLENLYTTLGGAQQLVNRGVILNRSVFNAPGVSIGAFWVKKFKKIGRTFSINLGSGYNKNLQESFNKAENLFVKPSGDRFSDSIDQKNSVSSRTHSFSLSVAFTEPIVIGYYLELMYGYSQNNNSSSKITYNYNVDQKRYDIRDDSLSNAFINQSYIQQFGIKVISQRGKFDYSFGLNMQLSKMDNQNINDEIRLMQYGVNFFPSASFNYPISVKKRLQVTYSGSTQQPSVAQLQPVPDNSNPLYIQAGNPDLKSAFSNYFSITYSILNPVSSRVLSVGLNSGFIANKIVNVMWFDSLGRQISRPLNVNGAYNINTGFSISFPLKVKSASINASTSMGFNRDINYVNDTRSSTVNLNISPNLSFNYDYKELFSLSADVGAMYNRIGYDTQKENDTWLSNYRFSVDGRISLPLKFVIGGNLDYMLNIGRDGLNSHNAVMLNAFVSKSLLKGKGGVRFRGLDLLNRNVGISRIVGANYIEDVQTNVLERIFLISFSYSLNKSHAARK